MNVEIRTAAQRREAIGLLTLGALLALGASYRDNPEAALACLLVVVPVAIRVAMLQVTAEGDVLLVRNLWTGFAIERRNISRFAVHDVLNRGDVGTRTVWVLPVDEEPPRRMQATSHSYLRSSDWTLRGGVPNEADAICDQLNAWLRGTGA